MNDLLRRLDQAANDLTDAVFKTLACDDSPLHGQALVEMSRDDTTRAAALLRELVTAGASSDLTEAAARLDDAATRLPHLGSGVDPEPLLDEALHAMVGARAAIRRAAEPLWRETSACGMQTHTAAA